MDPNRDKSDEVGDEWIYDAVKRDTYFFVNFTLGRLGLETCKIFLQEMTGCFVRASRTNRAVFYSDTAKNTYTTLLPEFFSKRNMKYGQLMKCYSGGRFLFKKKKVIYGRLDLDSIETINIENMHGILRERIGRLVRKTKCFSKKKARLQNSLDFFRFYWNFINLFDGKSTPAMLENLIEKPLNWHEFLHFQLSSLN